MKTIKYFIFTMKAPKEIYGGFTGKLKHFNHMLKLRAEARKERLSIW